VTFEVTQEIRRVGTFNAESDSDALTLAKQKFAKQFGYIEDVRYTVRPILEKGYEAPSEVPTTRRDPSR